MHPDFLQSGYFVKGALGSLGEEVQCMRMRDLRYSTIDRDSVVQKGIMDVQLFEGRKCIVRIYVLEYDGRIYMFKKGLVIVHAGPYNPESCSRHVQIDHKVDGVSKFPLEGTPFFEHMGRMKTMVEDLTELFRPHETSASDPSQHTFALYGLDVLFTKEGRPVLLEVNSTPNMNGGGGKVQHEVRIPVARGLLKLLLFGDCDRNLLWRVS